jgi:hypothetical protein
MEILHIYAKNLNSLLLKIDEVKRRIQNGEYQGEDWDIEKQ